jgi:hypothetical protein
MCGRKRARRRSAHGRTTVSAERDIEACARYEQDCVGRNGDATKSSVAVNRDRSSSEDSVLKDRAAKAAAILKRHFQQDFDGSGSFLPHKSFRHEGVSVKACSSDCSSDARCYTLLT